MVLAHAGRRTGMPVDISGGWPGCFIRRNDTPLTPSRWEPDQLLNAALVICPRSRTCNRLAEIADRGGEKTAERAVNCRPACDREFLRGQLGNRQETTVLSPAAPPLLAFNVAVVTPLASAIVAAVVPAGLKKLPVA